MERGEEPERQMGGQCASQLEGKLFRDSCLENWGAIDGKATLHIFGRENCSEIDDKAMCYIFGGKTGGN